MDDYGSTTGLSNDVTGEPRQTWRDAINETIRTLKAKLRADIVWFHRAASIQGRPCYVGIETVGGPAAAALKAMEGEPIDRESIDLQRPGRGLAGTLVRASVDAVLGPAHHRQVYGPAGLTHELSMLVYEGRRFVGRIVAAGARRGFASSAPRYWNSMRASLMEVVREVDVQRRQCLPTTCGMFVIDTTRRVEFATDGAWPWLSHPEFRERFGYITPPHDGLRLAGEAQVKITPMTAPGRVGMMVEVAPASPVTLAPDGALTPTQRRVAEYACEGLTTQQIAKAMQMSVETVRTHMREVYRRLGVASRVELVAKMRLEADDS